MNILLIGSGGREHAMAWKIRQNPDVKTLYCIPGNGGIALLAECHNIPLNDHSQIIHFVREKNIDLTLVGPEVPLVNGIVDDFFAAGLPIFGPNKAAAQMEGSKVFSKQLMEKYQIPTADYREFNNANAALAYIDAYPGAEMVIKADGLAAGKGAIVCMSKEAAREAVRQVMTERIFADAGSKIIIEEFMTGEECSIFVVTDGKDYFALRPAQDFKRALDGDQGKNTGGMGSYAPTPFLTDDLHEQAVRAIIEPTLAALRSEGIDYRGILYCGLMLTPTGPRVVEFNCRFGDPETQVVLPLLDSDLVDIALAVHEQRLGQFRLKLSTKSAACVVLASGGYPDAYEKGKLISGLDKLPEDIITFHAGTQIRDGELVTSGGRVMALTAVADSLETAIQRIYSSVQTVEFDGMQFRSDIAKRALS